MKSTAEHVASLVDEYTTIIASLEDPDDTPKLQTRLMADADWTGLGAASIIYLAQHYGSFVLSNALALAEALEIEDGACGL